MRTVDGKKVAFIDHDAYFASLASPSMYSTAKATGAVMVLLLAPGRTEDDFTDDELRAMLAYSTAT